MAQPSPSDTGASGVYDLDAERSVLASIMLGARTPQEAMNLGLGPYDFHFDSHTLIFLAALALSEAREPTDALTVADACERRREPVDVLALHEICDWAVPHSFDRHVRIVVDHARRRDALNILGELASELEVGADFDERDLIRALVDARITNRSAIPDLVQAMETLWTELEFAKQTGGLKTGWPSFDESLGLPIMPGEVILVGARTGVGKTWQGTHFMRNALASLPPDKGGFCVSLEMTESSMWIRLIAQTTNVDQTIVHQEMQTNGARYWSAVADDDILPRIRVVSGSYAVSDLPKLLDEYRRTTKLDPQVVMIDYLGLLQWKGNQRATLYERASETVRALKPVALQENVTLIIPAQLSREKAGDGSKPPPLDALRDTGAAEEAVDRVIGMWSPGKDSKLTLADRLSLSRIVHARLLKNRHGPDGAEAKLVFTQGHRLTEVGHYG